MVGVVILLLFDRLVSVFNLFFLFKISNFASTNMWISFFSHIWKPLLDQRSFLDTLLVLFVSFNTFMLLRFWNIIQFLLLKMIIFLSKYRLCSQSCHHLAVVNRLTFDHALWTTFKLLWFKRIVWFLLVRFSRFFVKCVLYKCAI